jgi:5-methylcytosine-specific restriction endonuclease McrA
MQVGHKKAYSKGGATTLANSVCLCYKCNKNQGTDSFETYKKKLNGTYGKRSKTQTKKTVKKRKSSEQGWINPITGRKEKLNPWDI